MTQTNPNLNERGETFEEYQKRVASAPAAYLQPSTDSTGNAKSAGQVIVENASDPIVDALRTRLIELETIAVKHLLESQSNRQQVRELAQKLKSAEKWAEKGKLYRRELRRVTAKQRLLVLELRAMKEKYNNLVRLGIANADAAYDHGFEDGQAAEAQERLLVEFAGQPSQFVEEVCPPVVAWDLSEQSPTVAEAVDDYFNTPSNN